jgi:hypothetical protein
MFAMSVSSLQGLQHRPFDLSTLIFAYNAFVVDSHKEIRYRYCMRVLTRTDVVDLLKKRQGNKTLRVLGLELGLSAAYLSDVFHGNREPGPTLLTLLGLERTKTTEITYTKVKP